MNAFVRPAGTAKRARGPVQPTHSVWAVETSALARTMPIATPSTAPASACQVLIQRKPLTPPPSSWFSLPFFFAATTGRFFFPFYDCCCTVWSLWLYFPFSLSVFPFFSHSSVYLFLFVFLFSICCRLHRKRLWRAMSRGPLWAQLHQ